MAVNDHMTESDWEHFFDYLDRIVSGRGDPEWKRDKVLQTATRYDAVADLHEFAGWFANE
jgi:hypothetical protein